MKIAFPTSGHDLAATLDDRFGRAARFLVVDSESGVFEVLENSGNVDASQGSGIQSAQAVIAAGAQALVASHCGPKAFQVFQVAGTRILKAQPAPISDLLEQFRKGEIPSMELPEKAGRV